MAQLWAEYVFSPLLPSEYLLTTKDIAQASAAANRILDLRHSDDADGRLVSLDIGDLGEQDQGVKIEFRDVWFRYPTRDVSVLNGLNMTVRLFFQAKRGRR